MRRRKLSTHTADNLLTDHERLRREHAARTHVAEQKAALLLAGDSFKTVYGGGPFTVTKVEHRKVYVAPSADVHLIYIYAELIDFGGVTHASTT